MADEVWLEVPDWRARESYAARMTDIPDTTPASDEEFSESPELDAKITEIFPDDARPEAVMTFLDESGPSIDDVLAGNTDEPDPDDEVPVEDEREAKPEPWHSRPRRRRFPVESEPAREPALGAIYRPPAPTDHVPREAHESPSKRQLRLEKESMSRQERVRRGW